MQREEETGRISPGQKTSGLPSNWESECNLPMSGS
ncbi:hypothetical protein OIU78_027429 [Salix suchowensis]|nr:hypothetical protein OIU78_027429 [Salix suchowensis]